MMFPNRTKGNSMLENLVVEKKQTNCKVRTILGQLDDADRAILLDVLADRDTWLDYPLFCALRARGVQVSPNVLSKHRAGNCSCTTGGTNA